MFPIDHSVMWEEDYLSPFAAALEAWKLRGEVIAQDFDRLDPHAFSLYGRQSFITSRSIHVCSSQKPRSVRRCNRRVRFDDYIEVAMNVDEDCELFHTFVRHDALQDWNDKPWFYCPKPPSRKFSWRTISIPECPLCNCHGMHKDHHIEADSAGEISLCPSFSVAEDYSLSFARKKISGSHVDDESADCNEISRSDLCSQALRDVTNTVHTSNSVEHEVSGAPLSHLAVSSSHPSLAPTRCLSKGSPHEGWQSDHVQDKENNDWSSIMQIDHSNIVTMKNSPMDLQQAYQMQAFQDGHIQHDGGYNEDEEFEIENSDDFSPGDGSESSNIGPPPEEDDRQDVILFHLGDQPIRAMVTWKSYEDMMHEIAHHFSLQREDLVDVYEIVVPPPDIGIGVVPTIVHVVGDTHPVSSDRLVLIDVEYHGHRIECHFRTGPNVLRCVKPLSQTISREEVLFHANVDRYCRSEAGRCLVFINSRRWPDYDLDRKSIAHGDYFRVVVPPSDRYSCPTVAISDMTQRGLSDQQILDEIYVDDAASGYSPSLLDEDTVRGLATQQAEEPDGLQLMQRTGNNLQDDRLPSRQASVNETSNESVPQDWAIDLHRLVSRQFQRCEGSDRLDFDFSVYTWFLDQQTARLCREPRIAMLGDDPSEWRDDILEPWRHHIRSHDGILIDLVSPHTQRVAIEEHIAHIIITQRPNGLNSVLFSMEFVNAERPSVIVRFAAALSAISSPQQIEEIVPLYHSFVLNRQEWINPPISDQSSSFQTRFGMGIIVRFFPQDSLSDEDVQETSLLQQNIDRPPQFKMHCDGVECYNDECSHQADALQGHCDTGKGSRGHTSVTDAVPCPRFVNFSLTEEFVRYIQAASVQAEGTPALLEAPDGLRDQPAWVQDIWEKWTEGIQADGGDVHNGPRLETWFTNPRRWTRCEQSRVVVLSTNFHQWERELLAAWTDRADFSLPTQFAIVFPTPPDADQTVQEQLVIEQQSEPFSRSIVVTVCDTARNSGRHGSLAMVVSDRLHVQSLITLLGYSAICPPERNENECIMWMGNIAIHVDQVLNVRNGNALRFLVRRGIRIGISQLLSMTDGQIRQELQAAIDGVVYRRPNVPGFPADPYSMNNPITRVEDGLGTNDQHPPDWLNALQALFDDNAFVENSDEGRIIYVLVWFVHGGNQRNNDDPRTVRLDSHSQWWRSELVFPWRDHFQRATPIHLHCVDPMPPREPWQSHAAHIIVSQAMRDDHVGVLVTTVSHHGPGGITAQEARIVNQFSGVRDFLARHRHANSAVHGVASRGRLVFPDDQNVRVGHGDSIVLRISSADSSNSQDRVRVPASSSVGVQTESRLSQHAHHEDGSTDERASDDASFMQQHSATVQAAASSRESDESLAPACAIEIDADASRESDSFQFNPSAAEFLPQNDALPEWAQVIFDIYQDWDVNAFAWQGESRAAHFMTWFLAPGIGRLQCLYGRRIALFADFWNWHQQLRSKWIDEIDQRAEIELVYVSPPPSQLEPGTVGHIILTQHNSPEWSSILLTTYDPAINNRHPFHMAHSFGEQLQFQDVLQRIGYTQECLYHAQCVFSLRNHPFNAADRIRASDGDAIDLVVNRHFLPANWNPPFLPHAPGAEGLALLQVKAQVHRANAQDRAQEESAHGQVHEVISLSRAFPTTDDDVESVPFTLSLFFQQQRVQQNDMLLCVWEINNGGNQFDLHPKKDFSASHVCVTFQKQHRLIQTCSELFQVRFTRGSWNFQPDSWFIGSFACVPSQSAVVACVIYQQGSASVRVRTLPNQSRTNWLREVLNVVHGTFVRVNGEVANDEVTLASGDVLEYHGVDTGRSFLLDKKSKKVQICLDASIMSHQPVFNEDEDAFEILPGPDISEALRCEDDWAFHLIPEGTHLHRETFEALHEQHRFLEDRVVAYELYVDGATHGDRSAWAVVAVAVTSHGRVFHGCVGGLTTLEKQSHNWIGAEGHTNIDAELSAMAVATAFAFFGANDAYIVIRPDLALSKRYLDIDATSRQSSVLATVVHVLGQMKPDNVEVQEVRAHCGNPWNELADSVAKRVAFSGLEVGKVPWSVLHQLAESPSTRKWEWLRHQPVAYAPTMPKLHGDAVWQPTPSAKTLDVHVEIEGSHCHHTRVNLRLSTYNGLALNDDDQSNVQSSARSLRLDLQFDQAHIAVAGIQEARTAAGVRVTDHYKIFASGFQQCGRSKHFGCELWVHKSMPIAWQRDGTPIKLSQCKVTVTLSEPRLLVAHFEGPINFSVVVAHAPCVTAERPIDQVVQWWNDLTPKIGLSARRNTIVLIDANAPLADHETPFFGMHHSEAMNQQGHAFQDFLIANELYVPSTFSSHVGPSTTWKHPRGGQLRRDYVLLSKSMFTICVRSQVWNDFDGGFGHLDHCPATCVLEGIIALQTVDKQMRWDFNKMHDPAAQKAFEEALVTLPLPSWEVSIDDHSALLESNILQLAAQHFGVSKKQKVRPILQESTLAGIQLKRQALDMARQQGFQDDDLMHELKTLEKVVRARVLADQRQWYADWLDSINDDWTKHDVAHVYKRLQRLGRRKKDLATGPRPLPRLKIDHEQLACTFEECQQVWKTQFAVIEAGVDASDIQLEQLHAIAPEVSERAPDNCPDPCQVLALIRRFKNGKVPGPGKLPVDVIKSGGYAMAQILTPLLAKATWHLKEPLSWKGGLLVPLFKGKGSPAEPTAYRSIFLSDICAKIHHANMRQNLAEVWNQDDSLIQLGGRKGCSTDVAHHLLHAHLAWARAANVSCAILFVDLQSAFYSVLRSSFFEGEFHDDAICFAMQQLGITPHDWHEIRQSVEADDATDGLSSHHEGILKDMFSGTHFSMQGVPGKTATMRGTRPGDPVADILFNMVFRLVVLDARSRIQASTSLRCFGSPQQAEDVSRKMPVPDRGFAEVTFVDDIAYAIHSSSPADVIRSLQIVSSCLHDAAASRGLTINYQAGKTEALIKLAGPGSKAAKHKLWHEHNGKLPIVTENGTQMLQLVHSYKHLGSFMQDHAVVLKDIRYRVAQARKAFGQLSRQFYCKRNVRDATKSAVFAALVMSRHSYNAHTWAWVTENDLGHWENGIRSQIAMLARNAIRPVPAFHFNTAELCAIVGLDGPIDLLHANRLRYVKRATQIAPSSLWTFLYANDHENSWLPLLMSSYRWLRFHLPRSSLPDFQDVGDLIAFIALDEKWKGRVRAAIKSCHRFTAAQAKGKLWTKRLQMQVTKFAVLPEVKQGHLEKRWKCNLCTADFDSKKALAVHARHKHQYRTRLKYFVLGDECLACGKKFFNRPRLLAHVGASQYCKDTYYACFVPATEAHVEQLELEEREQARCLRAQGWSASKAFLPMTRIYGPLLPGSGTEDATIMQSRWNARISETGRAYEGLAGYCEHLNECHDHEVEILPFLLQSNGGQIPGAAGVYMHFGLAAETARLHITCFTFVHFFSGFRRKGDLQHCIESHEIVGHCHIFCISVDLCLAKQFSDLTDLDTKEFWINKMRQGHIIGIGGGPSCETWSAARHMPDGPLPLRSYDSPWGIAGLTGKQWDQVSTGTKLIQFLIDLLVVASQIGLCGFIEHPQFPVWLMKVRPASIWMLPALRTLARLECVQLCSFDQCIYGLDATKPTTLMLLRLPTFRDVTMTKGLRGRCSHQHQHRPLKGIQPDGTFSTARAKIYPEAMNKALAFAVSRFLAERQLLSGLSQLPEDMRELNTADFTDMSIVQPDYHR